MFLTLLTVVLNTETIAGPLAPGDTSMYVFTATADMSADGVYDVDLSVTVANDSDPSNNNYSTSGENKYTPGAPSATGDTICRWRYSYTLWECQLTDRLLGMMR